MTNKKTSSAIALEMKQIFRKDPPVTFDTPVIRVCNASQRAPLKSQMREPARAGAMAAAGIQSRGIGC